MLDGLTHLFVPVHREGHRFVAIAAVATLLLFLLSTSLGWLGAMVTAWVAYFFRDPDRVTPLRPGLVVSPSDGRVLSVETLAPPSELGLGPDERTRVAVHLSMLDVHIQRAPIAGIVRRSLYIPGALANVSLDKASDANERRATVIGADNGEEIIVVQIAGWVARRIVSFVSDGTAIGVGERIGMIRFGSRVDLWLPPGRGALVAVGQRMIAGETVVADDRSDESGREARRI
jgi:phosphatidylserine decarboxylase